MPTTPIYGLPYQSLSDPPNGPTLGEDLANAVEAELQRLDTPPVAQLRQTVQQTISNSVWSAINFDTEDIDSHNGHSTATNPSRYTCQRAGIYLLGGAVAYSSFTSGTAWVKFAKNGTDIPGSGDNEIFTGTQIMVATRPVLVPLAVGEYIELMTTYIGANINTYVGLPYAQSSMCVQWVRP